MLTSDNLDARIAIQAKTVFCVWLPLDQNHFRICAFRKYCNKEIAAIPKSDHQARHEPIPLGDFDRLAIYQNFTLFYFKTWTKIHPWKNPRALLRKPIYFPTVTMEKRCAANADSIVKVIRRTLAYRAFWVYLLALGEENSPPFEQPSSHPR